MTHIHRFIGQNRNLIASAVLAATNTKTSNAIRRSLAIRTGNGTVSLSGPFSGASDSNVDIEITAGSGTPRITDAAFVGVGTGTMADMAAKPAATEQTYTVELINTGTTTAAAEVDIEGVTLKAKSSGSAGNTINLTVDQSGLIFTPTDYSLLEDINEGTEETTGHAFDWDTAVMFGDAIPATAKRLCFGDDRSVIYRQCKAYRDGEWRYLFYPAIARNYKAGDRIYEVTGSRTCTLTDGTTPETYTNVITLYDLLAGIRDSSALIEVDGVLSPETTPENTAAVLDLRTRTDARIDWTSGEGSDYATGFINHFAGTTAATEIITAECYAHTASAGAGIGREKWKLTGSVSGDLGSLATGEPYPHPLGRFGLTIPSKLPDGWGEPRGEISFSHAYAGRTDTESKPPICSDRLRIGDNATDKSITFVYTARPTDDCACDNAAWSALPGADECLYLDPTEGIIMPSNLPAGHAARLGAVQKWHADFVAANTQLTTDGELRSAIHDIRLANSIRSILLTTLARLYADGAMDWDDWAASTAIEDGESRQPTTPNGYKYEAQGAGTTSGTEPTWPTTIGGTIVDGGVTWECVSKLPAGAFDDLLTAIGSDLTSLEAIEADHSDYESIPLYAASTAYTRGNVVRQAIAAGEPGHNGVAWVCLDGGTSGAGVEGPGSQHTYDYPWGYTSNVGGCLFMSLGKMLFSSDSDINETDGESSGINLSIADFVQRYQGQADAILARAEVTPDFSRASSTGTLPGGVCWRDTGESYWWVAQDAAYLPAFTNAEYVSVKAASDGESEPIPTHEFGFVIKVACVSDLKEGDSVTISIGDAVWPATYQTGDKLFMATVAASPLYLQGGVTGNDTFTWSVNGSTDGHLSDYSQDLTAPALYSTSDLDFRINAGGIAHAVGDKFTFGIEAATFRWRQDAGAWSADLPIESTALADGLSVDFTDGQSPSFISGDSVQFVAMQPYSIDNAASPTDQSFAWTGAGATITATTIGAVDAVMLALHTLPDGATVNVSDGGSLNQNMTWREGPMVLLLDTALSSPTLTITISNAAGGSVGWLWAGEALSLYPKAKTQDRLAQWRMLRGEGVNARGSLAGTGRGFNLEWNGFLSASDVTALLAMADHAKQAGGLPVAFVPHNAHQDETELVSLPDELAFSEFRKYHNSDIGRRNISLSMRLDPWLI